MEAAAARAFIAEYTAPGASALVPQIKLHLATELTPLWQASEAFLREHNLAPPFWAFAWPGSEALAHLLTARPELVAGRRVLDFAAGGGLAAIAAARAGAAQVTAAEIDPLAAMAITMNAELNGCAVQARAADVVGEPCRWDVIVTGDVCYEAPMTRHILPWLRCCARDALVLLADPGRAYLPKQGLTVLDRVEVPTTLELEDRTSRLVTLFRLHPD